MGACCISVSKPNVYAGGLLLVLLLLSASFVLLQPLRLRWVCGDITCVFLIVVKENESWILAANNNTIISCVRGDIDNSRAYVMLVANYVVNRWCNAMRLQLHDTRIIRTKYVLTRCVTMNLEGSVILGAQRALTPISSHQFSPIQVFVYQKWTQNESLVSKVLVLGGSWGKMSNSLPFCPSPLISAAPAAKKQCPRWLMKEFDWPLLPFNNNIQYW